MIKEANVSYPLLIPADLSEKARSIAPDNKLLVSYLRTLRSSEVDTLFNEISEQVSGQVDCRQCANCCRELEAGLSEKDSRKLAGVLHIPLMHFLETHTSVEPVTGSCYLTKKPCVFLKNNLCKVYDTRPESCADFPGLHREGIKYRMHVVMQNYSVCPIVFYSVEAVKKELLQRGKLQ